MSIFDLSFKNLPFMSYQTRTIWQGIYSSHQRCVEAVKRLGLTTDQQRGLSTAAYVQLLQYRAKTAKGKTLLTVQQRLNDLGVQDQAEKAPPVAKLLKEKNTATPNTSKINKPFIIQAIEAFAFWATSRAAIFLTLLGALTIQIHHLASLVHRINENDGLLLAYIFATVSELTALMLTVHQARKGMLIIFALVQCWINILYYCNLPALVIRLTLSALIAFVIYSYSELFTTHQQAAPKVNLFNTIP